MSIFDKLDDKLTGMRRPIQLWGDPISVKMAARETGNVRPYTPDANVEHELSATVLVRFWANSAQLPYARETAERALATLLYSDVLAKLSQIEHAVMNDDGPAAYQACGEMRSLLTR